MLRVKTLNAQPVDSLQPELQVESLLSAPNPVLWRRLLSGNRERIAEAVTTISEANTDDVYAPLLLKVRRRRARCERRVIGLVTFTTPYTERERRSALSALGLMWGAPGRELAMALDPKLTHFDRDRAHKALIRRRDQRAVRPLIEALIDGHALEDWQCIATLGALGDLRAVNGLLTYVGLDAQVERPINIALDFGLEVGRALRTLNAKEAIQRIQQAITAPLPRQRASAALVLAGWNDDTLAPLVLPLLEDETPAVRLAAVTAVGELKANAGLTALQNHLNDPDPQVRLAVERALQQVITANAQRAAPRSKIRRADLVRR